MKISLAIHIIGIVFWLGGLLFLTRILRTFADQEVKSDKLVRLVKGSYFGFVLAGLSLALLTGLYQMIAVGIGVYMKQGWFHTKLTLVLALFVITALLSFEVKNFSAGKILSGGKNMAFHGISSLCLVVIVFLTLLGR